MRARRDPVARSLVHVAGCIAFVFLGCVISVTVVSAQTDTSSVESPRPPTLRPPPLSSHVMTYHSGMRRVVLFGGSTPQRTFSNTLWAWDGTRWTVLSQEGPAARIHAALAYDARRNRLVLHGGIKSREESFGDTWEWDGESWLRQASREDGPGIRDHHAMVFDRARGVTVLFGGQTPDDTYPGETWTWDGTRWRLVAQEGPPGRGTHRLAYDDARQRVVLTCGWNAEGQLDDTWTWDGSRWTQLDATGPAARGALRVAYDSARKQLVLFGGLVDREPDGGTWILDAQGWQSRDVAGPVARNVHGMAYDATRQRVVLYGGLRSGGRLDDVWEWDGRRWVEVVPSSWAGR